MKPSSSPQYKDVPMNNVPFDNNDPFYLMTEEARGELLSAFGVQHNTSAGDYVQNSAAFARYDWRCHAINKLAEHRTVLENRFTVCAMRCSERANETLKRHLSGAANATQSRRELIMSSPAAILQMINAFNYIEDNCGSERGALEALTRSSNALSLVMKTLYYASEEFAQNTTQRPRTITSGGNTDSGTEVAAAAAAATTTHDEQCELLWCENGNSSENVVGLDKLATYALSTKPPRAESLYYEWQFRTAAAHFFDWSSVIACTVDKRFAAETRARMTRAVWNDMMLNSTFGQHLRSLTMYARATRQQDSDDSSVALHAKQVLRSSLFLELLYHPELSLLNTALHTELNALLEQHISRLLSGAHYIPVVHIMYTLSMSYQTFQQTHENIRLIVSDGRHESLMELIESCQARANASSNEVIVNYMMIVASALLCIATHLTDANANVTAAVALPPSIAPFYRILCLLRDLQLPVVVVQEGNNASGASDRFVLTAMLLTCYRYVNMDSSASLEAMRSSFAKGSAVSPSTTPPLCIDTKTLYSDFSHLRVQRKILRALRWEVTVTANMTSNHEHV
jgi:hypothetical protein